MVVNSEVNHKSKTLMEVITDLVLDFIFYYVTLWESTLYMLIFALLLNSSGNSIINWDFFTLHDNNPILSNIIRSKIKQAMKSLLFQVQYEPGETRWKTARLCMLMATFF